MNREREGEREYEAVDLYQDFEEFLNERPMCKRSEARTRSPTERPVL